jgi:Activator of Hsp90 ATPase homolog 1-like protein
MRNLSVACDTSQEEYEMSERIERRLWLAASPEHVWDVVTSADWLADEVTLDLRPGGDASFRTRDEHKSGWVEEASSPSGTPDGSGRLAFWWATDDQPATRVELTLEPARGWDGPDGTRLRIVESRPLDVLDLVGIPLPRTGGATYGPALIAA